MDLKKSLEYFNPEKIEFEELHIIGVGSVGSTLAENLVRMGLTNIHLYDFDTVEQHNLTNQMFREKDIDKEKIEAVAEHLKEINSEVDITLHHKGYETNEALSGYVFLAVDSIETRKRIVEEHYENDSIQCIFDVRMALTDAQHYAATWDTEKHKEDLLKTMQFKDTEVQQTETACGTQLNVVFIVRAICAIVIANFAKKVNKNELNKRTLLDLDTFYLKVFKEKE